MRVIMSRRRRKADITYGFKKEKILSFRIVSNALDYYEGRPQGHTAATHQQPYGPKISAHDEDYDGLHVSATTRAYHLPIGRIKDTLYFDMSIIALPFWYRTTGLLLRAAEARFRNILIAGRGHYRGSHHHDDFYQPVIPFDILISTWRNAYFIAKRRCDARFYLFHFTKITWSLHADEARFATAANIIRFTFAGRRAKRHFAGLSFDWR